MAADDGMKWATQRQRHRADVNKEGQHALRNNEIVIAPSRSPCEVTIMVCRDWPRALTFEHTQTALREPTVFDGRVGRDTPELHRRS